MAKRKSASNVEDLELATDTDRAIAARVGPDAKPDGRFRKTFVLSGRDVAVEDEDNASLHAANKVATLQEALQRGLHPREDVTLDGTLPIGKCVHMTYSVSVILASEDEVPADTYTPSAALKELGGSTVQE